MASEYVKGVVLAVEAAAAKVDRERLPISLPFVDVSMTQQTATFVAPDGTSVTSSRVVGASRASRPNYTVPSVLPRTSTGKALQAAERVLERGLKDTFTTIDTDHQLRFSPSQDPRGRARTILAARRAAAAQKPNG